MRRAQCVSLEQSSAYARRVPRTGRFRAYSTEEQRSRGRMQCCWSCGRALARGCGGTLWRHGRRRFEIDPRPVKPGCRFSLHRPPAETCAAATGRPEYAGPKRSPEPATSRDALKGPGAPERGFPDGIDANDPFRQHPRRNVPGRTSRVNGCCRRAADSTPDPLRGRTRRPPGGTRNVADRPCFRFLWTGVSVPGVARPHVPATTPHLARGL